MKNRPSWCQRALLLVTAYGACIVARTSLVRMPTSSDLSDGKSSDLVGNTCPSMAGREYALVRHAQACMAGSIANLSCLGQNFALTEAAYVTVRLLQSFGQIEPRDEKAWAEFMTLTMAVRNGVKVGLYP